MGRTIKGRSRREFIGGTAAFLAALGWDGCVCVPGLAKRLPAWRPGDLDLHFIYTGCGENMFYKLPDGTSVLNDCGEFFRPAEFPMVRLLPSPDRLGGDWVSRYISRVHPGKEIDYAVFSHFHLDHIGHAKFGEPDKLDGTGSYRFRTTPDGRNIDGFLCVAEDFRIRRCLDHQYPAHGTYGTQDSAMELLDGWISREQPNGLQVEPFRVGALDQIRLVHDPEAYRGRFSIRNVSANGVLWDGRDGAEDFAAEHVRVSGEKKIAQNVLSATFVIRYGKFSYFATGDLQGQLFARKSGGTVEFEGLAGERVGPVTVCKMSHHGCLNAMGGRFVKAVHADAYVGCMWCPSQAYPATLDRLVAEKSATGERPLILPQLITDDFQRPWFESRGFELPHPGAAHVVIRVPPEGDRYRVYLLDAHDEEMRVVAEFDRTC